MNQKIVTLTTDWGNGDFFIGKMKGALYSAIDGVTVVDINHNVRRFNLEVQRFVVQNACFGFPAGTVHILDFSSKVTPEHPYIVVKYREQYYLCVDDGLPSMVFPEAERQIVRIPYKEDVMYNFAAVQIYVKVAAMLLAGASLLDIGPLHSMLLQRNAVEYVERNGDFIVRVLYVDDYGNAYLGMTFRDFMELRNSRSFKFNVGRYQITELSQSYHTMRLGNNSRHPIGLTVSSTGYLELAIVNKSFAEMVGIKEGDEVILTFDK